MHHKTPWNGEWLNDKKHREGGRSQKFTLILKIQCNSYNFFIYSLFFIDTLLPRSPLHICVSSVWERMVSVAYQRYLCDVCVLLCICVYLYHQKPWKMKWLNVKKNSEGGVWNFWTYINENLIEQISNYTSDVFIYLKGESVSVCVLCVCACVRVCVCSVVYVVSRTLP